MVDTVQLIRQGRVEEAWQRCCGFIDLSLEEFMMVQRRLLAEQLELLKECKLGRSILDGARPCDVEEYRKQVPLTTYADYAPYLLAEMADVLPGKPVVWQHTSGKSGEYPFRRAPVTAGQLREIEPLLLALLFFSSCKDRNDIVFGKHDKVLYGMAPPPYATGTMARLLPRELFGFLPPPEDAESMSFEERMQRGFEMALSEGLDVCFALSSVAVAIGDRFQHRSSNADLKSLLKRPKSIPRMARGLLRSKLARRPLLPRDLWPLKGLITFGMDSSIYRERIKEMWGKEPLEFHGCTEATLIAMQTWDRQGMTFIPHLNFLEFIPERESIRSRQDPFYQPQTLLLDEVKAGDSYELVITSFHGGPFVRYRLGHLVRITALRNDRVNIDTPQMEFLTRVDDQIDIAGFTRLSEKTIWRAIENAGLAYEDWTVRKEVKGKPVLHLYIELKGNGHLTSEQVTASVHDELKRMDTPYAELEAFTGLRPLETTLLPGDAFRLYGLRQRESGADFTQFKPPHLNPSDEAVSFLLNVAGKVGAGELQKVLV